MKQLLLIILAFALTMGIFSGCSVNEPEAEKGKSVAEDVAKGTENIVQDVTEGVKEGVKEGKKVIDRVTGKEVDTSAFIGEEKAKQIALDFAGVTEKEVIFDKIKLEKDDGVWQYEVEFKKGNVEYDGDIKAENGEVLAFDTDYND